MIVATVPGRGKRLARGPSAPRSTPGRTSCTSCPTTSACRSILSKNIIVHFFVPRALVATALSDTARPDRDFRPRPQVRAGSPRGTSRLGLRRSPRAILEDAGAEALAPLQVRVHVSRRRDLRAELRRNARRHGRRRRARDHRRRRRRAGPGHDGLDRRAAGSRFYASVARTFLESYRVAARGRSRLCSRARSSQKDLVKRAIAAGERMFLAGEIERREAVSRPIIENALPRLRRPGLHRRLARQGLPRRVVRHRRRGARHRGEDHRLSARGGADDDGLT